MTSVPFPNAGLVLGASVGGELVFVSGHDFPGFAFVDARTWPPVITHHRGWAYAAARGESGRWLVYATPSEPASPCALRWYESITSTDAARVLADPVPAREFSAAYAEVAREEAMMPAYLHTTLPHARQHVERVHVLGERAVAVPMHVGLDDAYRQPLIERDGSWSAITDLPPFERAAETLGNGSPIEHVRLADGTYALAWHGCLYAERGGRFEQVFEEAFDQSYYRRENLVASATGVFVIDGASLVELGPHGPRAWLPQRRVSRIQRGPRGTVIVEYGEWEKEVLLLDPARDAAIALDVQHVVGATEEYLIVHEDHTLRCVPFEGLAARPAQVASAPPERAAPPLEIFEGGRVRSRARIATRGTEIVIAHEQQVRYFELDRPTQLATLPAEVRAIACSADRTAALDATGTLHVLDGIRTVAAARVTTSPRTVLAMQGGWLVVGGDASVIVDPFGHDLARIAFERGIAAAIDPDDGALVLIGEERRLALYERGELLELPSSAEQVIAIAPLGGRRFACAGQSNLYVLDLANPELELWLERYTGAHLATSHERAHLVFAHHHETFLVEVGGTTPRKLTVFHTMTTPRVATDELAPTHARGLAFLASGRVVLGLAFGVGKIIDLSGGELGACLDPHPGDPEIEYVFTSGVDVCRWNSAEAAAAMARE